jgi:hypothetical protein
VEDSREIATRELHVLGDNRRTQGLYVHPRNLPARCVQERDAVHADSCFAKLSRNVHALDHLDSGAAHIDWAATGTKRAASFDDGYGMTAARQPIRKRAAGDSGAGNQDLQARHDRSCEHRRSDLPDRAANCLRTGS